MSKQKTIGLVIGAIGILFIIMQTFLIILQMNLKTLLGLLFIACICNVIGILFVISSLAMLLNIKEFEK